MYQLESLNMAIFKNCKQYQIFIYAVCIILIIFFLFWFGIDHFISDIQERGTFGDKFGAVNSLFSGLAFAGLIYTIYLQQEELRLQREELRQTREEMARQTKEFDEQNRTLQIQRFENTFFNMLRMLQEITQGLTFNYQTITGRKTYDLSGKSRRNFDPENVTLTGRAVFEGLYKETDSCLEKIIHGKGIKGYNESNAISLFDHYFRYLYRIMKFVDTSSSLNNYDTRYQYMAMLRGQLSRYELIWLYYNGLSDIGSEKLKPLIEKYAMLKNIRQELIVDTDQYVGEYTPSAFGLES